MIEGAWFWVEPGTDPNDPNDDYWACGYRDGAGVSIDKLTLNEHVRVSTEYTLQVYFDADRRPHFLIDGTESHMGTAALADVDVKPRVYAIGNAKTLYVRSITTGKDY